MYRTGTGKAGAIADHLTEILEDHAHGSSKVYPTMADGVVVIGGVAPWTVEDDTTEVIPSGVTTDYFDIHYVNVEAVSASDVYELVLFAGAIGSEVEISRMRTVRTSTPSGVSSHPVQGPIQDAGTRISAKVASDGGSAEAMTITVTYHHY